MSASYEAGKAWGRMSVTARLAVALFSVAALIVGFTAYMKPTPAQPATRHAVPAPSSDEVERERKFRETRTKLEEERAVQCSANRETVFAEATRQLKAGAYQIAINTLERCPSLMPEKRFSTLRAEIDRVVTIKAKQIVAQAAATEKARKKREGVRIGMSQEDVLASSWGKPRKINSTTTARGTRDQWVYGGGYLYFDDGVLTAIQN